MGGERCEVSVIAYPLIFLKACTDSHDYDVKWLPRSVPFEIDYLREGGASFQISLIPYFFELNYISICISCVW